MSATSDLCDAVVSAIDAAIVAAVITRPISFRKTYVANQPLEESEGIVVSIKSGRPDREPSTLDGSNLEVYTVRLVVESKLRSTDATAVEAMLDLVELLIDEIQSRVPARNYLFVAADPEDDGAFDEDKLRNMQLFYSVTVLEFEKLRQVA